jgi:hypothetical protein
VTASYDAYAKREVGRRYAPSAKAHLERIDAGWLMVAARHHLMSTINNQMMSFSRPLA